MSLDRTSIVFVRHGECRGNLEGMFRGKKDFPLNERGKIQANEVARSEGVKQANKIYSSPLLRARETAQAIAGALNLEMEICEEMTNINLGSWEGRLKKEIAEEEPILWDKWLKEPEKLCFPGMETLEKVKERSRTALDQLVEQNRGSTFIVVTHRTVLKPLLASCLGIETPWFWRLHFDTASTSTLINDERGYSMLSLNRTDHLSQYISEWN